MDVPTLSSFLRPILIVASVLNTGETFDINTCLVSRSSAIQIKSNFFGEIDNNNKTFVYDKSDSTH